MTRITINSANYSFPTCFCKYKISDGIAMNSANLTPANLSLKQTNILYELANLFDETCRYLAT